MAIWEYQYREFVQQVTVTRNKQYFTDFCVDIESEYGIIELIEELERLQQKINAKFVTVYQVIMLSSEEFPLHEFFLTTNFAAAIRVAEEFHAPMKIDHNVDLDAIHSQLGWHQIKE